MDRAHRTERFQELFVQGIANLGDHLCESATYDYGVDACLKQMTVREEAQGLRIAPTGVIVDLQLKAVLNPTQKADEIKYPLPVKNFNDMAARQRQLLNGEVHVPLFLILFVTQEPCSVHLQNELRIRGTAYWYRHRGVEPTGNSTTKTISVSTKHIFDINAINDMFTCASTGDFT